MQRTHFAGRARVRWLLLRCDELKANIGTGGRNASMYQPKQSNPTMKRRMPKPNMLQLSAMSPTADSAEESERAQVVQAVSFRRTRLMPKDRHLHLMTVGAILLFGMGTEAFTSPLTRYSSHNSICSDFFPGTLSSSSSSALFVASMSKKNSDANPVFGREGGADSVGLQSEIGAEASRLHATEMTSILDDGSGHVNAELAQSIWQWGEYGALSNDMYVSFRLFKSTKVKTAATSSS